MPVRGVAPLKPLLRAGWKIYLASVGTVVAFLAFLARLAGRPTLALAIRDAAEEAFSDFIIGFLAADLHSCPTP